MSGSAAHTSAWRSLGGRVAVGIFWVAVWFVAANALGNPILLAGPVDTLLALGRCFVDAKFWAAIGQSGMTFASVAALSAAVGVAAGLLSARCVALDGLFAPVVHVMKSAPVACVVVILLVVFGSQGAVRAIVAFVALPPFYVAAREAFSQRPRDTEQVLRCLGVSEAGVFLSATWPACLPFFHTAAKTSIALSWRAGVTGELLSVPLGSIGAAVYASKLTLDTPSLLAWTGAIMVCGWACERIAVALLDLTEASPRLALHLTRNRNKTTHTLASVPNGAVCERALSVGPLISLEGVSKSYGAQRVLNDANLRLDAGSHVCLMAPTGSGKTTLLRVVLGIEQPDGGTVVRKGSCAPVLQQATLVEQLSARDNVLLCASSAHAAHAVAAELEGLLPYGCAEKRAEELSGGTRRLVEIARVLYAPGDMVVLDEPFAGLDVCTRERACAFIMRHLAGRALVVATHDVSDARLLNASVVNF